MGFRMKVVNGIEIEARQYFRVQSLARAHGHRARKELARIIVAYLEEHADEVRAAGAAERVEEMKMIRVEEMEKITAREPITKITPKGAGRKGRGKGK